MLIECNKLSENEPVASLRGNNGFVGLKNQLEDITMHFVGITLKGLVGSRLLVKKTPFQRRCKFAPPCYQLCCLFAGYLDRALTAAGRAGGEAV